MTIVMLETETIQPKINHDTSFPAEFPARWACDWGEDKYGLWMAFRYRGIRQNTGHDALLRTRH